MKEYTAPDIRNFAVVGHAGCGKTTLCEAILAKCGTINRMGTIAEGTTVSDYHDDEKEHQISMHASLLRAEWLEKKLNIVDAPGYSDFVSESLAAIRVADFALIVVHAHEGVGVGTERAWKYATEFGIPKVIVINSCDSEKADIEATIAQIKEHFGNKIFPMTMPLNPGPGFNSLLDVMRTEKITYKDDGSGLFDEAEAEGADLEKVKALHQELIEYVAEADETLMEKFFENDGLSEEELRASIHAAIQAQSFTPVYCTAAEGNIGVTRLLDFISKFGSSPLDRHSVTAQNDANSDIEVELTNDEPVAFVFKTLIEEHIGELSFFRIYSGKVEAGTNLLNTVRRKSEKVGQILLPNGKQRDTVDHLMAGDIGALVKLKQTHTNDTLSSPRIKARLPMVEYPVPNIHAALEATSKGDEEKIAEGLALIHEEDPAFDYRIDPELHQTILSGQGDIHLKSACETLKRRYNVDINLTKPRVPYRETIEGKAESRYRHKKQSGGAGQFAEVWMRVEAKPRGGDVEFGHSLVGNNVDRGFAPSVEKGVRAAERDGILSGCRVIDIKVDFYDGKQHPVDSKDVAFQIAGKNAFKEAFLAARPCLLEPILDISVRVPEDATGAVMGDLSSRGGQLQGVETEGALQVIKAKVPQRSLHAYATDLRSLTGGRGEHRENFSHYEKMPKDIEQGVIAEHNAAHNGG